MMANGQFITCDGGCGSRIPVPVGLRALLGNDTGANSPAAGWLFVAGPEGQRHYCPKCGTKYLDSLIENGAAPLDR